MRERSQRVSLSGGGAVTSRVTEPDRDAGWTFIYAPGAGANIDDPFGKYAGRAFAERGVTVVRMQFPYMEAGKRSPDRPAVLESTWRDVIEAFRTPARKLAVGGRSMGGRIASQVVAHGIKADALALFAYPLHAPGKPDQLRDEHLPSIKPRTLFCSGTNDAFASAEELRAAASKVKRATVHLLDGADHGFAVKKSTGRTKDDVFAEAVDVMITWLKL